jgi:hypothetical protein
MSAAKGCNPSRQPGVFHHGPGRATALLCADSSGPFCHRRPTRCVPASTQPDSEPALPHVGWYSPPQAPESGRTGKPGRLSSILAEGFGIAPATEAFSLVTQGRPTQRRRLRRPTTNRTRAGAAAARVRLELTWSTSTWAATDAGCGGASRIGRQRARGVARTTVLQGPCPTALRAATRNRYWVPLVSRATRYDRAVETPSTTVVHLTPSVERWMA